LLFNFYCENIAIRSVIQVIQALEQHITSHAYTLSIHIYIKNILFINYIQYINNIEEIYKSYIISVYYIWLLFLFIMFIKMFLTIYLYISDGWLCVPLIVMQNLISNASISASTVRKKTYNLFKYDIQRNHYFLFPSKHKCIFLWFVKDFVFFLIFFMRE